MTSPDSDLTADLRSRTLSLPRGFGPFPMDPPLLRVAGC